MTQSRAKKKTVNGLLYFICILVIIFFLFPILWTLSLSFKTVPELYKVPPAILPESLNFDNYKYLVVQVQILRGVKNSVVITGATIVGAMLIAVPAAYAFSRIQFKGSNFVQFLVLMFQMISPLVIVIPLYRYFAKIGLLNTTIGLVMIYIAISAPFQVWFLKSFFDTIPKELDEAACIDGCNRLQVVTKILVPTIIPGIFSGVLMVFISSWSQFVVPYILMDTPSKMPLACLLVNLQSTLQQITTHYLAAASILTILPTVLLFLFLQKYIVSALTAGAVKG